MPDDPVVEELHRIQKRLLQEHGGLDGNAAHLEEMQTAMKNRVVTREPKKPYVAKRKIS